MELRQDDLPNIRGPLFNAVMLCGVVVGEPEPIEPSEVLTVAFELAVPKVWKSKATGRTEFRNMSITVRAWADLAKMVKLKLTEGMGVLVQGRLEQHTFKDERNHTLTAHYVGARYLQWWDTELFEEDGSDE